MSTTYLNTKLIVTLAPVPCMEGQHPDFAEVSA
jgi:hypothetical protein